MGGGDASGAAGISFGFKSVQRKAPLVTGASLGNTGEEDDRKSRDYITGIDRGVGIKSTVKEAEKKVVVIPLQDTNEWQPLPSPAAKDDKRHPGGSGEDDGEAAAWASGKPLTAEEAAAQEILDDLAGGADKLKNTKAIPLLMRNPVPNVEEAQNDTEKYRIDVAQRPEEPSFTDDCYEKTSIEDFGAGLLRGMGWKEGEAIGSSVKGLAEPVEFIPRPFGLGLGATRDSDIKPGKHDRKPKKYVKPGESRDRREKEMVVAGGPDGQVRHIKKASETLVEKEVVKVVKGARVVITGGPHKGQVGEIERLRTDRAEIRLTISDARVDVQEDCLRPLSRADFATELRQLKRRIKGSGNSDAGAGDKRKHDAGGDTKSASKSRREPKVSSSSDRGGERRSGQGQALALDAASCIPSPPVPARYTACATLTMLASPAQPWLAANIRVRIVSERLDGGRLYNQKVKIVDVITPTECTCVTDGGRFIEGVKQRYLETLIPKQEGGVVLIVAGKWRGRPARILDRSSRKAKVWVQPKDEEAVVELSYDDVCEYVGRDADW